MKLKEICWALESWAPLEYQESYDNSRLLYGSANKEICKALVSLDVTQPIVEEAIQKKAELIIAHHPLIFGGLKSLTGKNDAERALILAIQNDIAIYALHTNLDNISSGVNAEIGRRLGIQDGSILAPKKGHLKKLVVFVPTEASQDLSKALWAAGAGELGAYDQCSYRVEGTGSFRGSESSNPTIGSVGKREEVQENRLEFLVESAKLSGVLKAMLKHHPYEEVAHEIYTIENKHQDLGSGMYGNLAAAVPVEEFLEKVKNTFGGVVRYTKPHKEMVQKIAWCGGSGSFLLAQAKSLGADVFLSSDFKYHQFFEADNEILIADIGHYENEQFTIDLIAEHLRKKFPNFAVLLTENSTNPINYL
jgi:dinuclear metal center YbgI/SA1388 family protein